MKKKLYLLMALLFISIAYGQYEEHNSRPNPRPIDSSEEYDARMLNQMERVDGEGDERSHRQKMQETPDESLPGYGIPEEGYIEDVNW